MAVSLVVEDLHKSFRYRDVLRGVSFMLEGGAIALSGANGSGKSTLLAVIAGLIPPSSGMVTINGLPLKDSRARALIGYVPESLVPFASLTVGEFFQLIAALRGAAVVVREDLLSVVGKTMSALSLGERRRVCLAAALTGSPPLLILDEPSNGLDTTARQSIAASLVTYLEGGGSILMATHDLPFARELECKRLHLCDGVFVDLALG